MLMELVDVCKRLSGRMHNDVPLLLPLLPLLPLQKLRLLLSLYQLQDPLLAQIVVL